jgi:hypothetical protein
VLPLLFSSDLSFAECIRKFPVMRGANKMLGRFRGCGGRLEVVQVQLGPPLFVQAYPALETEAVRFVVYSKGSAHIRVPTPDKPLEDTDKKSH